MPSQRLRPLPQAAILASLLLLPAAGSTQPAPPSGPSAQPASSAPCPPAEEGAEEGSVSGGEPCDPQRPATPTLFEALRVVGEASSVPGSAVVIDATEMARQGHGDIHRVLRQVPGIYLQEEDGYGLRPNVGMRGAGGERSSKIALLEDGVLIAPAPYAAPAAYYFPTVGRMHSIEVRKGSSSIRQGPNTTGGVLNLISTPIPGELGGSVEAQGGDHGTTQLVARAGDTRSRLGWVLETYRHDTDGFKELDGGGSTGFEIEDYVGKLRWSSAPAAPVAQAVELKLGSTEQLGDETYLGLTQDDFERTPLRRYAASREDRIDTEHRQFQLSWLVAPSDRLEVTTTLYRNDFFRNWAKLQSVLGAGLAGVLERPADFAEELAILRGEADSAPGALALRNNRRDYESQGIQSAFDLRFDAAGVEHSLELGVRLHEDFEDRFQEDDRYQMVAGRLVLSAPGAPGSQANRLSEAEALALYAQHRVTFGGWTLSPGVRFESIDFRRTDWAGTDPGRTAPTRVRDDQVDVWIPGLGLERRVSDRLQLFAGLHRGFSPPGPGADAATEPEESLNAELGARWTLGRGRLEAIGFASDYDNLLGRDTLASGGGGSGDLFNGGAVDVRGLELSWSDDLARWAGRVIEPARTGAWSLPVRFAYTYTEATFESSFESDFGPWGTVDAGDELPYLPPHQLFVGVGIAADRWQVHADLSWLDRTRTEAGRGPIADGSGTDARWLLDLAARVRLVRGVELIGRVRNATDEVYVAARRPAGARPGLPRTATVGLAWSF
ncbi:MAG TPA: TonB-dependent receptor [Thermoanaerobaculia bacterium]|nr:TonB-dependent receptor [Thermoanaerobaculia bacterium]